MGLGPAETHGGYNVDGGYSGAVLGCCLLVPNVVRCDMFAFILYVVLGALVLALMLRDEDWEE